MARGSPGRIGRKDAVDADRDSEAVKAQPCLPQRGVGGIMVLAWVGQDLTLAARPRALGICVPCSVEWDGMTVCSREAAGRMVGVDKAAHSATSWQTGAQACGHSFSEKDRPSGLPGVWGFFS